MRTLLVLLSLQSIVNAGWVNDSIRAEYPTIDSMDDWQKTTMLRQWVWSHTLNSYVTRWLDYPTVAPGLYDESADKFFDHFRKREGGVMCRSRSHGLRLIYKDWGFESWNVGTGNTTATHSQTLVQIVHRGKTMVVLHDAMLNFSYVHANSDEPLEYVDMLVILQAGRHEKIKALESDWSTMPSLPYRLEPIEAIGGKTLAELTAGPYQGRPWTLAETLADGTLVLQGPSPLLSNLASNPAYVDWLAANGHPNNLAYMHLHPNGVTGDLDGALANRIAADLAKLYKQD